MVLLEHLDANEAELSESGEQSVGGERARDALTFEPRVEPYLRGQRRAADDVAEHQAAAGLEHSPDFGEDLELLRREVDDTVGLEITASKLSSARGSASSRPCWKSTLS